MTLVDQFKQKNARAFSRLVSLAEAGDMESWEALSQLFKQTGKARVFGITGPPGAGKSSLINQFVSFLRKRAESVAVLAVDPTSPFTGGALLGDRIRLVEHFNDEGVFIRSLSTRGKLGGLSLATREAVHLADAFGFQNIIIETVGVGQSEVDIHRIADLCLVVLVPEWGDAIQTLKAGLLEIADVFTVHKADREGAAQLMSELKTMLHMAKREHIPVLSSSVQNPASMDALFESLLRTHHAQKNEIDKKRERHRAKTIEELVENWVVREAKDWVHTHIQNHPNPYQFVLEWKKKYPMSRVFQA